MTTKTMTKADLKKSFDKGIDPIAIDSIVTLFDNPVDFLEGYCD